MIAHDPRPTANLADLDPGPDRPTAAIVGSALVAGLGGLLFGFDTAVISGTEAALRARFALGDNAWGFTVASALIGTILGSIVAGRPADGWGRRKTLMALAGLFLVGSIGCGLAWGWWPLVAFRFLGGLGVGGASVVAPLYIAEIAPAKFRGRLVALMQFNIVFGILVAFASNYAIARLNLGADDWRWMLGVLAIPSAAFLLLLIPTPESPRWLVARGRVDDARRVLAALGLPAASADREILEIAGALASADHEGDATLFRRANRKPIALAIAIAMFNQLSGINALLYYAPTIFKMAGAGANSALLQAVAVGGTNLVFTMLAMAVIDRFGRRRLMLVGSIGYLISLGVVAWAFYTYGTNFTGTGSALVLGGLLLFIASHAFGQGAVIWVFIGEIFPNRVRARGQALGSTVHWVMAAAITWTFPLIAAQSGGHVFAFYAAMMALQLLWVIFLMPETKGVPLEEIQKRLGID